MRWMLSATCGGAVLLVAHGAAHARGCQIANVTPMQFGGYEVGSATPVDSVGELDVMCDAPTPVRITLGRGFSGRQTPRQMSARGNALAYNLFLDAARTLIWGDGAEGTQPFVGVAPAIQLLRIPIFGRVFGDQRIPPGTYTDSITVFVSF